MAKVIEINGEPTNQNINDALKQLYNEIVRLEGLIEAQDTSDTEVQEVIRAARWSASGTSGSRVVWGTEDFNDDSTLYSRQTSNTEIVVAEAGIYFIATEGYTIGATVDTGYTHYVYKNNGAAVLQSGTHSGNTGGHVRSTITGLVEAAAGDYFDVGSAGSYNTSMTFSIFKIG